MARHVLIGSALLAYAVSFGLHAVSREGAAVHGFLCAYATLVRPLVVGDRFFQRKTALFLAYAISGWINVAFLASLAMRLARTPDWPSSCAMRPRPPRT